jgi:hypothetical protein
MPTNALISITKNGETYVKIIAGCEGQRAGLVVKELMSRMLADEQTDLKDIYNIAKEKKLGCEECLVVMSETEILYEGFDEVAPGYRETFDDPRFNPRTSKGDLGYLYIIPVE